MGDHLDYQKSERSYSNDYRNGYKTKQIDSSYSTMVTEFPQDCKSTFGEPQVVKKRPKDTSDIDQKINMVYAKGMISQ